VFGHLRFNLRHSNLSEGRPARSRPYTISCGNCTSASALSRSVVAANAIRRASQPVARFSTVISWRSSFSFALGHLTDMGIEVGRQASVFRGQRLQGTGRDQIQYRAGLAA